MKILQVNKYYYHRRGADVYMLELSELLERAGHQVIPFAMKHPQNIPTDYSRYFVSEVDLQKREGLFRNIKKAFRVIYSFEARKKFEQILQEQQPDVIHMHNIYHQLSPSILYAAKKAGVPVVMTIHDHKLVNPNYRMFHRGKPCEHSRNGKYWEAIKYRCMDSFAASVTVAVESYIHKWLGIYEKHVDRFISPSVYMIERAVDAGYKRRQFVHVPHFAQPIEPPKTSEIPESVVYFGSLSEEKGIMDLLNAAKMNPGIPITIVGRGPQESALRSYAGQIGLPHVRFVGFKVGKDLWEEVAAARVVVMPTISFENAPLSVLEAQSLGKIIIATNKGGFPEMIDHGEDGFLVPPSDPLTLAKTIEHVWSMSAADRGAMEGLARARVLKDHSEKQHVQQIVALYRSTLKRAVHVRTKAHLSIAMIGQKGYPVRFGGVERHVAQLSERFGVAGNKVRVYARPWYSEQTEDPKILGVKRTLIPSLKTKHLDTISHTFLSLVHAIFFGADVYHIHGVGPALLAWMPRLFRPGSKVVVTVHSLNRKHTSWGPLARLALLLGEWASVHLAHETIVVSAHLRDYMRKRYRGHITMIPNGVSVPLGDPSKEPLFVWDVQPDDYAIFLGRLVEEKGVHTLIEAWKRLGKARGTTKLLIVGDKSFSKRYVKSLTEQARGDASIVFTGWQEGDALHAIVAHARFMVQPSLSEGLPLAVLEGMMYGLPVLVSDIPAHRELVENKKARFEVENTTQLLVLLKDALANPSEYKKMGHAHKEKVMQEYRWDTAADRTLQVYRR